MALLRAVGTTGHVTSVDLREDHNERAARLIGTFFGGVPENLSLVVGRVEDHIADIEPDRIVLDLPEPWHSVPAAVEHMAPGGVFTCYLPTVPQVQEVRSAMAETGRQGKSESWHFSPGSERRRSVNRSRISTRRGCRE